MADYAYRVERALVGMIDARATRDGYQKGQFARLVWPWVGGDGAPSRWSAIRNQVGKTGKLQNLTVSDLVRMCAVIHEDPSFLLSLARGQVAGEEKSTD